MTVVYRGASTPNSGNNTATVTLAQDIPSLANGDYMLMALYANSGSATPPQPPGDWRLLESEASGSFFVEVWGKIAASEGADYTITKNTGTKIYGGIILAFRSDAALTLYLDAHDHKVNASSANYTCPGVTTTQASAGLACFFASSTIFGITPAAGMTERLDSVFNSGVKAYAMTSILTSSGATGDKVATGTAAASRAVTVAIAESASHDGGASIALDAIVLSAAGVVAVKGDASITLGTITLSASQAVTAHGAASMALGAVTLAAVGVEAGATPSSFAATPLTGSRIDLTWVHNGVGIDGFSIERSTSEFSGYSEIATPAAGDRSYSDTGLTTNTRYYYRIRSYRS